MPDLEKLYEKAEKYLQKQKFESALETFLEIYKIQPNDEAVLTNVADLSSQLNRTADALRFQALLVDQYVRRNDMTKAIVTCRKILKTSPQDVATLTKMAGLLEKSKQNQEALKIYREALELHRAAKAAPQALDTLQHIVKLNPNDLEAQIELGELASRTRLPKLAAPAYLQAARLAREAGQEDRWAEFVERAYSLDSADQAACLAAGELFLKKDRAAESVALLEPMVQAKPDDPTVVEHLVQAYLKTGDYAKAEPLCWKIYMAHPEALPVVIDLIEALTKKGETRKVLDLLGRVRTRLFQQGKRDEYLKIAEKVFEADESNLEILEMLTGLYNELNRDEGLRRSLGRLFNLYLGGENYEKAADTLERILDVDPYAEGHYDRLLTLEGHIDNSWYKNILARVEPAMGANKAGTAGATAGAPQAAKTQSLEDLVTEGEMYLQYQLTTKLKETLEKISQLYPGAEERVERLRELYEAAGLTPKRAPAAARAAAGPAPTPGAAGPSRPSSGAPSAESLADFQKISEISASLYREATAQGVMQTAVNKVGQALSASRCWGGLGSPDRPPALTLEYCSPSAVASEISAVLKLYSAFMAHAATNPDGWLIGNCAQSSILTPVHSEIRKLAIKSLLALPLMDQEAPAGLLLLEQCDQPRAWTPGDALFLKAIATQIVIAVNNTKLRRMVRALAGSEGETGLHPRSSYLDFLLAEARRAKEQGQSVCVCLLEPDNPAGLISSLGDAGVQRYMEQFSKALQSNLRQNDVAVRYSPCAIAIILPDTPLPQAGLALEKLRRVVTQIKANASIAPPLATAVCDMPLGPSMDAVDGVTEVINRLESALDQAHKESNKRVLLSKFEG